MKIKKITKILIIVMSCITLLTGCSINTKEKIETQSVIFNKKIINLSGQTIDTFVVNIKDAGEENYTSISVVNDEIILEVTEEQRQYWLNSRKKIMNEVTEDIKDYGDNYEIIFNDDYTSFDMKITKDMDPFKQQQFLIFGTFYSATYQIFAFPGKDWKITTNVYDAKSGRLVATGDTDTGLSYNMSDWEE